MSGFNYVFDATQHAPEQSAGAHPIGKFLAMVSNTAIKPTANNEGGMYEVEFTTEAGRITSRYNLWNASQKAVDIAHKQLSALSHVTGVFRIDMNNEGAALRGARCMIEVGKQKDSEYVEVKRVFDVNGNEPGKAPAPVAAMQPGAPQQQPTQPPAQAWGGPPANPAPVQQPAPQQAAPAWGAPQAAPQAAPAPGPSWSQQAPAQAPADNKPAWAR